MYSKMEELKKTMSFMNVNWVTVLTGVKANKNMLRWWATWSKVLLASEYRIR